jgi:hypothetical protein
MHGPIGRGGGAKQSLFLLVSTAAQIKIPYAHKTNIQPARTIHFLFQYGIYLHPLHYIALHYIAQTPTPLHSTPLQQRNHTLLCPGSISCITLPISSIPSLHHHGSRRTPSFKIQDDYNDAALCVCFVYRSLDLLS